VVVLLLRGPSYFCCGVNSKLWGTKIYLRKGVFTWRRQISHCWPSSLTKKAESTATEAKLVAKAVFIHYWAELLVSGSSCLLLGPSLRTRLPFLVVGTDSLLYEVDFCVAEPYCWWVLFAELLTTFYFHLQAYLSLKLQRQPT
jgi:hypothetical protein